ncbi:hypothetical protein [Luteimonas sp. MHLX1A]|uniref:hypothetical protein n=1 Tax=Alterluteimonas muca TaxID=2878684 RepID=UPI001E45A177|nr:hypothetical protein [Luteimonas sp. MHLX1A]MCD9046973.1 hypothetical protein [Luteimonas sp. MHLX1A]
MKPVVAAALALMVAACSGGTAALEPETADGAAASACAVDETVVFACATGAGQGVALCGSQDASRLRYVETGEAAARWPETGMAEAAAFRSGTLMYSGGGGAYLRFDRDGREYTVYTGIGRGWEKAGVLVQEDGRTVRALTCEDEVASLIGPELFQRASIPADESGFEIP